MEISSKDERDFYNFARDIFSYLSKRHCADDVLSDSAQLSTPFTEEMGKSADFIYQLTKDKIHELCTKTYPLLEEDFSYADWLYVSISSKFHKLQAISVLNTSIAFAFEGALLAKQRGRKDLYYFVAESWALFYKRSYASAFLESVGWKGLQAHSRNAAVIYDSFIENFPDGKLDSAIVMSLMASDDEEQARESDVKEKKASRSPRKSPRGRSKSVGATGSSQSGKIAMPSELVKLGFPAYLDPSGVYQMQPSGSSSGVKVDLLQPPVKSRIPRTIQVPPELVGAGIPQVLNPSQTALIGLVSTYKQNKDLRPALLDVITNHFGEISLPQELHSMNVSDLPGLRNEDPDEVAHRISLRKSPPKMIRHAAPRVKKGSPQKHKNYDYVCSVLERKVSELGLREEAAGGGQGKNSTSIAESVSEPVASVKKIVIPEHENSESSSEESNEESSPGANYSKSPKKSGTPKKKKRKSKKKKH